MALAVKSHAISRTGIVPRRGTASAKRILVVRKHNDGDDDVLPIWRLPGPPGSAPPPETLPKPKLLGGKTIGEELSMIHDSMQQADLQAAKSMQAHLYSANWAGDEYRGGAWNVMTVLAVVAFVTPLAGLLFAWLSYGTLWTGSYHGL